MPRERTEIFPFSTHRSVRVSLRNTLQGPLLPRSIACLIGAQSDAIGSMPCEATPDLAPSPGRER